MPISSAHDQNREIDSCSYLAIRRKTVTLYRTVRTKVVQTLKA